MTTLDLLMAELSNPVYADLSDEQAADTLNQRNLKRPISRFGSFRTLANLLTQVEYETLRAALSQASQGSSLIADTVRMLELPGDEKGNGGGIDFGTDEVRARVSAICTAAGIPDAATKINGYAEDMVSWSKHYWGYAVQPVDVEIARAMMEENSNG